MNEKFNLIIVPCCSFDYPAISNTATNLYLWGDDYELKKNIKYYCTNHLTNAIYISEKFLSLIKFNSVYSENMSYIPVYVYQQNQWQLAGYTNHFDYLTEEDD